jgi:hypothetical protein
MKQRKMVLEHLRRRSETSVKDGGDGFVDTSTLVFDVGLNTRTIRSELDAALQRGEVMRRSQGPGKSYLYRV